MLEVEPFPGFHQHTWDTIKGMYHSIGRLVGLIYISSGYKSGKTRKPKVLDLIIQRGKNSIRGGGIGMVATILSLFHRTPEGHYARL